MCIILASQQNNKQVWVIIPLDLPSHLVGGLETEGESHSDFSGFLFVKGRQVSERSQHTGAGCFLLNQDPPKYVHNSQNTCKPTV